MVNSVGAWKLDHIQSVIPQDLKDEILRFQFELGVDSEKVIWNEIANGIFNCQSAYQALQRLYGTNPQTNRKWNWIWKAKFSNKLQHFMWLASQGRLTTNHLRKTRKIVHLAKFPLCSCAEETVIHTLRDCPAAVKVWRKLIPQDKLTTFLSMSEGIWMELNITNVKLPCPLLQSIPWCYVFIAGMWHIWKARNHFIFKGT